MKYVKLFESWNKQDFLHELKDITNSKGFLKWLKVLSGDQETSISKEELISGFCEDLAFYLHYKYDVPIYVTDDREINDGHYFVKYDDKYYDGMNPEGYDKPSESEWSKRLIKRTGGKVTANMIDSHLKLFNEKPWSEYEKNKHIIEK
jgi:hypothetical protein